MWGCLGNPVEFCCTEYGLKSEVKPDGLIKVFSYLTCGVGWFDDVCFQDIGKALDNRQVNRDCWGCLGRQ